MMFILPIIFSYVFLYSGTDNSKIKIPVADQDETVLTKQFIYEMNQSESYKMVIMENNEVLRLVEEGSVQLGIILPKGFANQVANGEETTIQLVTIKDTSDIISFQSVLASTFQKMIGKYQITNTALLAFQQIGEDINMSSLEQRFSQLLNEKWEHAMPMEVVSTILDEKTSFEYDPRLQTPFGFMLFFSMYTVIYSIGEMLNDRKYGIWDRLIHSPLSKLQIYMGNFVYSFMVSFIQIALIILTGRFLLGFNFGDNIWIVFSIIALYIFAIMALGMLLVSFVKTTQQLQAIVPIIAVSNAMLGGAYWPIEIVTSKILLTISKFVPITYAMKAVKDAVLYHQGWDALVLPGSTLLFIGIILMGLGMYWIERKVA